MRRHTLKTIACCIGLLLTPLACTTSKEQARIPPEQSLQQQFSPLVRVTGFVIPVEGGPIKPGTQVLLIDLKDRDTTRVTPLEKNGAFGITSDACRDYLIECHVDGKPHWRDRFTAMCSSYQSTEINIDLYDNITLGPPNLNRQPRDTTAVPESPAPAPVVGIDEDPYGFFSLIDKINTPDNNEQDPVPTPGFDWLFFSSDRAALGSSDNTSPQSSLFYSRRLAGVWQAPMEIFMGLTGGSIKVRSAQANGTGFIVERGGDLFTCEIINGIPGEPRPLPALINSPFREGHGVFIDETEAGFCFTSDRPGGMGGSDLYLAFKRADGSFGEPVNMEGYNTPGDETSASFTPGGDEIWFTSNGRYDSQGLDVYRAEFDPRLADPYTVKVDAPVGSAFNELDVMLSADGQWCFYSSDRPAKQGVVDGPPTGGARGPNGMDAAIGPFPGQPNSNLFVVPVASVAPTPLPHHAPTSQNEPGWPPRGNPPVGHVDNTQSGHNGSSQWPPRNGGTRPANNNANTANNTSANGTDNGGTAGSGVNGSNDPGTRTTAGADSSSHGHIAGQQADAVIDVDNNGEVSIICPVRMEQGVTYIARARMARTFKDSLTFKTLVAEEMRARKEAGGTGEVKKEETHMYKLRLAPYMSVDLVTPPGQFTVVSSDSLPRDVRADDFVDWTWMITPTGDHGSYELRFRIRRYDERKYPTREIPSVFAVTVELEEWHFLKTLSRAATDDPQWTMGALVIPLITFIGGFFARKKKKKAQQEEEEAIASKGDGKG